MIPLRITFTEYDRDSNTCKAQLPNGDIIIVDPFVGSGIQLTNEEYLACAGGKQVGKSYVLVRYTVYRDCVVPHEGGMVDVSIGER